MRSFGWRNFSATTGIHTATNHRRGISGFDGWGAQQTIGYTLHQWFAPAARVSVVDPSDGVAAWEVTGGLNMFLMKHRLKLTTDVTRLFGGAEAARTRARIQIQVSL